MSKSYSARLLNHTEPVVIDGVSKTAFYSEHSIDISVGDKLFVLNGNYDSDSFPYKNARNSKFVDGYRVLMVDKCKIVLDINWDSNIGVYEELDINEFIKVWNVRSVRELVYYESITIDLYEDKINRYAYRKTNDIIFIDKSFVMDSSTLAKFKHVVGGVTVQMDSPIGHFFGYDGGVWLLDDYRLKYNTYNDASQGGVSDFQSPYNITNNKKLYIIGEDIEIDSDTIYRQRSVYKYNGNAGNYVIDIDYKKPLISKLNFRGGTFSGNYSDGVFGTYLNPIEWDSNGVWNGGFFVNSKWVSGELHSNVDNAEVFKSFVKNGIVTQVSDSTFNNGFGYNYVIDSTIESGVILNGNFENCNIGSGLIPNADIEGYSSISNVTGGVAIYGGYYDLCDIDGVDVDSSTISSSKINSSSVKKSRLVDSQVENSYIKECDLFEDSEITITGAEVMCDWLLEGPATRSVVSVGDTRVVFSRLQSTIKMWISEVDYFKLNSLDSFFITKLNKSFFLANLSNDELVKLPIETEIILDKFYNLDLSNMKLIVSLKTKRENKYETSIHLVGDAFRRQSTIRSNGDYSIDIQINGDSSDTYGSLAYYILNGKRVYYDDLYTANNKLVKLDIDKLFTNAKVSNFNIKSGLVELSNWISGSNMSRSSLTIKSITTFDGQITFTIPEMNFLGSGYLAVGDNVWLDGVTHNGNVFADDLVVSGINILNNSVVLSGINGVVYNGTFVKTRIDAHVVKVKVLSTKISGGFFNGTMFQKSTFSVNKYENNENITLSNIDRMCVVNSNFDYDENGNTIENGIFHKCNFISGTNVKGGIVSNSKWYQSIHNIFNGGVFTNQGVWENGIFSDGTFRDNSIWENGTFLDGTFKDISTWKSGTFNGGNFYNSIWKSGDIRGGIFGNAAFNSNLTEIKGDSPTQSTNIYDITVTNAIVGGVNLVWNGGTFNGGEFKDGIWNGGTFNGGNFTGGIWNDGNFTGGKFISLVQPYSWNNGTFTGGEFGNKLGYGKNSSWNNGVFQGGVFQGHTWNNGTFTNGIFNGGKWLSDNVDFETYKYLDNTPSSQQYGIWNNGDVVNNKFEILVNEYTYNDTTKTRGGVKASNSVEFNNILWKGGNFNHPNGTLNNSVWFSGVFKRGFVNTSFINPYVRRVYGSSVSSFGLSTWEGGTFNSGKMYKTTWDDGIFNGGEMWGSVWKNGTWNYGYANGILWLGGRWRNGNWDGSPYTNIEGTTTITTGFFANSLIKFVNDGIVTNNSKSSNVGKIHINNYCKYVKLAGSNDANVIGNYIKFPLNWFVDSGVNASSLNTVVAQKSTDKFRLNVTYCDDIRCYPDADLFIDVFYGYEVEFSFGGASADVYVHLEVGELQGAPNIENGQIAPGSVGYGLDTNPVIRLNTSPTTVKLEYFPKLGDVQRMLTYRIQNYGNTDVLVNIIDIKITRIKTMYDNLNNTLINFNTGTSILPNGVFTNIKVENGNIIKFKYGNGSFEKGVWENGVWNDGYRTDNSIRYSERVTNFTQITEFVYIITLEVIGDMTIYSLGDKVSVSNIVGIDYNNKRTLLKGSLVIRNIIPNSNSIVLEVVSNYKLRLIVRDSNEQSHLIKISQNVWLSGLFLNGVFNGIMNYGVVSGFPYITHLHDTHMIDGIFDGGKIGSDNTSSLVQNFIFYDNVVIKRNFYAPNSDFQISKPIDGSVDRFYRSWAAFKYIGDNNSVNVYSNDTVYVNKWGKNSPVLNHAGQSTNDVVSSKCTFVNLNNIEPKTYDFGVAQTVYNQFIPQDGLFTYPFKVGANNSGLDEFEKNGWSINSILRGDVISQLTTNYDNTQVDDSNILFVDVLDGGSIILNNTGRQELYYDMSQKIEPERYSVIEFQVRNFDGNNKYDTDNGFETPSLYFGNAPTAFSINKSVVNHLDEESFGDVRREYFYNRKSLDMYLLANQRTSNFEFKSIKFNEVDMIPFFNYFSNNGTSERIDDSAKVPKNLDAPPIEYTDDYEFIDNITSTIDISSLNIPSSPRISNTISPPNVGEPIINTTDSSVSITWYDPIDIGAIDLISGYEIIYGTEYPFSIPIMVTKNQNGGSYTQVISDLTIDTVYTIKIRSVGNKVGRFSSYVNKLFSFSLTRMVYYVGYNSSPGSVSLTTKIYFDSSYKFYVGTDNVLYSTPYGLNLANLPTGNYRVVSEDEFSGSDKLRTSLSASVNNNTLSTSYSIQPIEIETFDIPSLDWDNIYDNPEFIPDNPGDMSKVSYYAFNINTNITVGDRLYTLGTKDKLVSYPRWIAIQTSDTDTSEIVFYYMVRLNSEGIITDVNATNRFSTNAYFLSHE